MPAPPAPPSARTAQRANRPAPPEVPGRARPTRIRLACGWSASAKRSAQGGQRICDVLIIQAVAATVSGGLVTDTGGVTVGSDDGAYRVHLARMFGGLLDRAATVPRTRRFHTVLLLGFHQPAVVAEVADVGHVGRVDLDVTYGARRRTGGADVVAYVVLPHSDHPIRELTESMV